MGRVVRNVVAGVSGWVVLTKICKLFVVFRSSLTVRFVRLYRRFKRTYMCWFSIFDNVCNPSSVSFIKSYTFKPVFVGTFYLHILGVLASGCFSYVVFSTSCFYAELMVYFVFGPNIVAKHPSKSVGVIHSSAYIYRLVTVFSNSSCSFPCVIYVPAFVSAAAFLPRKYSSFWVIVKNRTQICRSKILAVFSFACSILFSHNSMYLLSVRTGAVDHQPAGSHFIAPFAGGVYGRW